jgi:alkylhydroperoxidase family enzyme
LFAHAVSTETDCLICSTFMRRILIDAGDDPDNLQLDDRERAVIDFGLALARNNSFVPASVYEPVAAQLTHARIVTLTAFGALMIATNVFNNALDVELDEYLWPYRRAGSVK